MREEDQDKIPRMSQERLSPTSHLPASSSIHKQTQALSSERDPEQPIRDFLFHLVWEGLPLSLGSICFTWQWGIQAQSWGILRTLTTLSRIFTRFQPLCQALVDQAESCISSETNPPGAAGNVLGTPYKLTGQL